MTILHISLTLKENYVHEDSCKKELGLIIQALGVPGLWGPQVYN